MKISLEDLGISDNGEKLQRIAELQHDLMVKAKARMRQREEGLVLLMRRLPLRSRFRFWCQKKRADYRWKEMYFQVLHVAAEEIVTLRSASASQNSKLN